MKVHEAMTPHKECVGPNDRLAVAQDVLKRNHVENIPVLDHKEVQGSLCENDISQAVEKTGRELTGLTVRETMNGNALAVFETDELVGAERLMDEHGVDTVTVVNADHSIVGVLQRHRI